MGVAWKCVLSALIGILILRADAQTRGTQTPESTARVDAGAIEPQVIPKVGGKISAPKVIQSVEPLYSRVAEKAKLHGICVLWLVVGVDGKPRDIRVVRSLGMGLDEKAIEAAQKWRFQPAMREGKPVAVQINIELDFDSYERNDALTELLKSAENGDPKALLKVSSFYFASDAADDRNRGMTLLRQAANQGLVRAQFQLAERTYQHTLSQSPDYVDAYAWYTLARRGGEKKADKPIKELTSKMSPEQLAEAQARVSNWKPTSSR